VILIGIVLAFASPFFIHYTGFRSASSIKTFYPTIAGYPERKTPTMRGAHGLDFSQIYLAARDMSAGEEVYYRVDLKRWRRKWSSTYHPFTHWVYIPISKMRFGRALVTHNLLTVGALLACVFWVLYSARLTRAFPGAAATVLAVIYLTPTGLLHLERGQLDLYVAASYACTFALFAVGGARFAVAAGLLSVLKVTAWAFIGLYWGVAQGLNGWRERTPWLLPATIFVVMLVFAGQVMDWLPSFRYVAENVSVRGPSFSRIMPRGLGQSIPLLGTGAVAGACYYALRRRGQLADRDARLGLLERISFPLAATLAIQAAGSTPVTHDYRLLALLGLLPALVIWCARNRELPGWLRHGLAVSFASILLIVARVRPFAPIPYIEMTWIVLVFSMIFLAATLVLVIGDPRPETPTAAEIV
jgi:hypothetical protein